MRSDLIVTTLETQPDESTANSKPAASNVDLVLQAVFLVAITLIATSILVCADMARSFRQADVAGTFGGQAMYKAAAYLNLLEQQEKALNDERSRITTKYVQAVVDLDRLSRIEYAARVQFRRILFQCYYTQYIKAVETDEGLPADQRLGVLTQRFLSKVYGEISKDAEATPTCGAPNVGQNSAGSARARSTALTVIPLAQLAPAAGKGGEAVDKELRDYCEIKPGSTLTPEQARECSYSNVIAYVSLHEGAKKRLDDLNALQKTLSDQIAVLRAQRDLDPALRNPASLETTRLLLSFHTMDDARGFSCEPHCPTENMLKIQNFLATYLFFPIERLFDYCFRTLLTAPALALTILLSLTTGAVGGAYRSAWVKYSTLEEDVAFFSVKDSLLLGAFLGAAVGLLTWLGLMTTGAVVGGEEGPAANLDPKLLAAIAVAAGLANREAMQFLVTAAQQRNGQPDPALLPETPPQANALSAPKPEADRA
jgi:hypothetical protein